MIDQQEVFDEFLRRIKNNEFKDGEVSRKENKQVLEVGKRFGRLNNKKVAQVLQEASKWHNLTVAFDMDFVTEDGVSQCYEELRNNEKPRSIFLKYSQFKELDAKNIIDILNTSNKRLYFDVTHLKEAHLKVFESMLKRIENINRIHLTCTEDQLSNATFLSMKWRLICEKACHYIKKDEPCKLPNPLTFRVTRKGWQLDLTQMPPDDKMLERIVDTIPATTTITTIFFPKAFSQQQQRSALYNRV